MHNLSVVGICHLKSQSALYGAFILIDVTVGMRTNKGALPVYWRATVQFSHARTENSIHSMYPV